MPRNWLRPLLKILIGAGRGPIPGPHVNEANPAPSGHDPIYAFIASSTQTQGCNIALIPSGIFIAAPVIPFITWSILTVDSGEDNPIIF